MRWLTFSLTCHLVLFSAVAFCAEAVETAAAPNSTTAKPSLASPSKASLVHEPGPVHEPGLVRESGAPIYYLKNQEGQLVPILGFQYEDFMELLREKQRDTTEVQPAQFTIDQTTMNGEVKDGRANLDIQLHVTTRQAGSIRVPIGLSQAIVCEDLKYEGDGSAFLDYDAKKKEYVVWIEGKKAQKHNLSLSVAISTATIGLDTRLRFDAPRSTRSKMTLLIPETGLDIHAPIESRLSIKEVLEKAVSHEENTDPKNQNGKKKAKANAKAPQATRLTVDSVRGDFQLLWHKPPTGSSEARTVMEASGEIAVTVGALEVTSEALLSVQGRGMPLDRFRIRLPKGTETYHVSNGNYQVTELNTSEPSGKATSKKKTKAIADESRVVEVRLSKPTLEPVLLHLTTTQPLDQLATPAWIEPAGFEVIDAVRQWGHVATVVGPDHFVTWQPRRGIRRVDTLPDTMNVKKPAAVFEYYSAPFSLRSRIAPRRTRVSVEPEHLVLVGADQLEIESKLNYMIRGKSVLALELDLGDWELDNIGPDSLVDAAGIEIMSSGLVTVPLLRPTIGRARLEVTAHRAASQRETDLEIAFPRPQVDAPGPAVVVILPDDNVKLLPDATTSTGLSRLQATPPSIQLPERQQSPLSYRGDAGQATFSAKRTIHEQQISVDIQSTIVFEMLTANVEQTFTYQIDHEPSNQIILDVPELLVRSANLEFLVDGTPVVPRILNPATIKQPEPSITRAEKDQGSTSSASTSNDEKTSTATKEEKSTTDEMLLDRVTIAADQLDEDSKKEKDAKEKETKATEPTTTSNKGTEDKSATNTKSSTPQSSATQSTKTFKTVPVVLTLKPAKIGQCIVTVRYSLPRRVLMPNAPITRQIPLATPAVKQLLHHELSVISPLGLTADVLEEQTVESPLNLDESSNVNGNGNGTTNTATSNGTANHHGQPILEPIADTMLSRSDLATGVRQDFKVTGRLGMVSMIVSIEKRHEAPSTTIRRAFFQTWVTDAEYQNRALFQFQTRQSQLLLTFPPATIDQRVRLVLNGKSLSFEPLGAHQFLITLPDTLVGLQQLELRWSSKPSREGRTVLKLDMPQLGDDAWIQRWYWQLLLPTGEHLLGTPRQLLSESIWTWSGGIFRRQPTMKTDELESWVGAEVSTMETPQANLYLFSSFGEPQEIQFRVANRSLIVLGASGLVLIAGFLLIYVPVTRHPASLLVLGITLGSLGVIYPEPMLLALQASSIGVVLVGLTALLKRRVSRPQLPKPIPIAELGGSSILDRDSTQRQVILPPIASHQETTETKLRSPE